MDRFDPIDPIDPIDADDPEDPTTLRIAVVFPGADQQQQFEERRLRPGTTALDLQRSLGLDGYALRKPDGSGQFFAAHDDVYAAMARAETSKLEAVPGMQVAQTEVPSGASGLLPRLVQRLGLSGVRSAPVVGPHAAPAVLPSARARPSVVGRRRTAEVRRRPTPLWQQRGWQQVAAQTWRGRYRLPQGVWEGEIEQVGPRCFRPWLFAAPPVVSAHPHASCLVFNGPGRHWLHFSRDPISVDAALMAMEDFLAASFAATTRRSAA